MVVKLNIFRNVCFLVAFVVVTVSIFILTTSDSLPLYMFGFIKEMVGCSVFSFVLALDTYAFDKIIKERK